MSKALNSPTARLLRSSRLFSLPPPLPAASLEGVTSSGILRSSDTATLPYPTHQAISTPPSSRHRGDWGLKRPLPSRSIPKSNPALRIQAIDNLNHITEFSSAADHVQTVQKWQEMNIPMSLPQQRDSMTRSSSRLAISAFEENVDNTAFASAFVDDLESTHFASSSLRHLDKTTISAERAIMLRSLGPSLAGRWKTEGPWVNGLTEEEFQHYLAKTVRKNRAGFKSFLEQVKIAKKKEEAMKTMRDEGLMDQDTKLIDIELNKQSQLDEHELNDWIKELRDNNSGLSSELSGLVRQYFDLPAFPTSGEQPTEDKGPQKTLDKLRSMLPERVETPPATHPSAGLSYIRSKAFLQNHPTYGPQTHHEPILARVVRPRSAVTAGRDKKATLGVGGFITEETATGSFNNHNRHRSGDKLTPEQQYIAAVSSLDPDTPGGSKVWVQPLRASVDENGYVQLNVDRADDQAVGVKTGNPVEAPILAASRVGGRVNDPLDSRPLPGTRNNANYGRALPDEHAPRRGAQGFNDAELESARGPKQAQSSGDEQIEMIQRLAQQHMKDSRK